MYCRERSIAGASVFTALLFGLLARPFGLGLRVSTKRSEEGASRITVVVTVLVHLFMTLLMVLKRMRSMYAQLRRFAPFTDKG
jgi:hypothetical protein